MPKPTRYRPIVSLLALLLTVLLFTQFVGVDRAGDNAPYSPEKVNLALRRTAHHLLRAAGDSASRIPAVQQTDRVFTVRLNHAFSYDRLPALLQQSLDQHRIQANYDVAVLDCGRGELQLGYNFLDYTERGEVPCGGRQMGEGCYTLKVTFAETPPVDKSGGGWWTLVFSGLLAGFVYLSWKTTQSAKPAEEADPETSEAIRLGNFWFNPVKQTLLCGDRSHTLTYREAKLLRLFASHPNQVLERDFILKTVWEDEGVTVGRSVDVFVSRLRKLLQDDPSVRIVAIHGIGYRIEVA